MRFRVQALSSANKLVVLRLTANGADDALRQAKGLGMQVIEIREMRVDTMPNFGRYRSFSLLIFSQELMALLRSGLNLIEALEGLVEKETAPEPRAVLQQLIVRTRNGERFSAALGSSPTIFPPLFVGLVSACETTGNLPSALARYVAYKERADQVRGKIISASIYPAILLIVGACVTLFLGIYVVPRFAGIYEDSGRDLPWFSQAIADLGRWAERHGAVFALATTGAFVASAILAIQLIRNGTLSRLVSRTPWLGSQLRLYELSRLYLTLGLLLESGIPITAALEMAGGVLSLPLARHLGAARDKVRAGESLSNTFINEGLTTPISLRLVRVGERSGHLDAMLIQAAAFHEGEVTRFIDRFTRIVEPALMAAIGIVVGGIVLLLYMPIFDLAGSMQ